MGSLLHLVGDEGHDEGEDGSEDVGWGGKDEGELLGVTLTGENDGKKVCEGVGAGGGRHEEEREDPDLEVDDVTSESGPGSLVWQSITTVAVDSVDDELLWFGWIRVGGEHDV